MSRYSYRQAEKESFIHVPVTCPEVDGALAIAANSIKEQTRALRAALVEALIRAVEAEERVEDLEKEIETLRNKLDN